MKLIRNIILYLTILLLITTSCYAVTTVTLAWDANTDPAVAGYKLYYGLSSRSYSTPVDVGKVTQYTLNNVPEGVNLYYAVTAYDINKNESLIQLSFLVLHWYLRLQLMVQLYQAKQ